MVEQARHFPLWPSLEDCVDGLGGPYALLCRRFGGGRDGSPRWVSLFVVPPDGVFIRSASLTPAGHHTLATLATSTPGSVASVSDEALDELVHGFLHQRAREHIARHPGRGLVIVPDGPLWTVPWAAAPCLSQLHVTLTPSLTVYARLPDPPNPVQHVVALIDDTVDGADELVDELLTARARGTLTVDFSPAALGRPCDLLLVLAHGVGSGLRFSTAVAGRYLSALEIAEKCRARASVIATCWSAGQPPVALPVNLPVSLLLRGAASSVGGMWALPQRATVELMTRMVRGVVAGSPVDAALALARQNRCSSLSDHWGLTQVGRLSETWRH